MPSEGRRQACKLKLMPALILLFLLGCVAGLRSLTAPALVSWAAHLRWLQLSGSKLAFINHPITAIVVSLLALVELVIDKLPQTPPRTAPIGLIARCVLGGACGIAVATSMGTSLPLGGAAASSGAIFSAFAGYQSRHALVLRLHIPDFVVALAEDAIAILGGLLIVAHV
jgi:uncharacterized membrane protein